MRAVIAFLARMRNLVTGSRDDARFEAEIETHIALLSERFIQQGMTPKQATRAARRQFGNADLQHQQRRDSRTFSGLLALGRDLRFAVRRLLRNPLLAVIAILSLGLGIGANTAIVSVARGVLLDPLPVREPQQLRLLTWTSGPQLPVPPVWGDIYQSDSGGLVSPSFSYPAYQALQQHPEAYSALFAFKDISLTATADNNAAPASAELVSGNAFDALGLSASLGRVLTPADDTVSAAPAVVLSDAYWSRRFGRAPGVIGQTIALNGVPVTIVGIAPQRFTGLDTATPIDLFVPVSLQPVLIPRPQNSSISVLDNPQSWWLQLMLRVRPGVSDAQIQAQLDSALRQAAQPAATSAHAFASLHLALQPGSRGVDDLHGQYAESAWILLSLSGLVLLLACVNLANLLLARAASRRREIATRLALGARRSHILRQLLTETVLLALLGGFAGLGLAFFARNAIPAMLARSGGSEIPSALTSAFDLRILAFAAAISLLCGMLTGLLPALTAIRAAQGAAALKDSPYAASSPSLSGSARLGLGASLVVLQIALSTILLAGAALFVRTLINLSHVSLGFESNHILLFRLNPPRSLYDDAKGVALFRRLQENLAAIPGVRSVSMSNIAIIGDGHSGSSFHIPGTPHHNPEIRVQENSITDDFFSTLGIPLLQGRRFDSTDTPASPPVAVINQALAQSFFPHTNPIGLTFEIDADEIAVPVRIIGIAANTRYADLRAPTPPTFYLSYRQQNESGRRVFTLRTAADPATVLPQVRAVVAAIDPNLPLLDARSMNEQVRSTLVNERIFARLTAAFGVLALILACIGIYGIMAFTVSRRTSEIGIRMALGAQSRQVLVLILRQATWMSLAGVFCGLVATLWLARFIRSMLYGLTPSDPITLGFVAMLLIVISLLAAFGPARRAAHIDPNQALRHE
ncbi:ADOP family duplicated permease [Acidicapsa dinghuensis]|uniref:ADOP family duplicated permease n=1 Tax=Acidicapsa dinghuensis TaxID=2218256 RepID=A0ABW1E9J9_9BACT|nr:ABC transporter permease [Acidicapsa dinghuensis]